LTTDELKDIIGPHLQAQPDLTEGLPDRVEADPECAAAKRAVIAGLPDGIIGQILSVGPAGGWELLELRNRYPVGGQIRGVTLFDEEARLCHKLGFQCAVRDMHDLSDTWPELFDLVFASHVLEHSPAPVVALREFYRVLKPGGYLACVLPDPEGVLHLGNLERVKRQSEIPDHVFLPSADTLITMLRCVGFEFVRYSEVAHTCLGKRQYWHRIWIAQKPRETP